MRHLLGLVATFSLISSTYAGAPSDQNSRPAKGKATVALRTGIKTPGIQIPFSRLKAEAEFDAPAKPSWLFFSANAYVPARDSLERIDPKTNKKLDPIAGLAKPCGGMTAAFGSLWAPVCGDSSLVRVDSKTFKVTATIPAGVSSASGAVASTADSVWLLTDDKTTLSRIDPDQNAVVGELRVFAGCHGLVSGETALWVACPAQNKVLRINPETNLVEKSIDVSLLPDALAVGQGSIWVLCRKDGKIDRIDPKTNKVSKTIDLEVPGAAGQLAFGEGSLWVTQTGFPLTRIDVTAEAVAQQFSGEGGGAIAVSPGAIWLSNIDKGTVWRIDPKLVLATIAE
jgi:streptogramin lyase